MRASIFALAINGLVMACGASGAVPDAAVVPVDARVSQGSEARSDLVINEVAPRSQPGADWIELFHRGSMPIDLCGYLLSDAADRLDHYLPLGGVMPPDPCPPRLLSPGAYLVVFADGTLISDGVPIDPAHAPFKLDIADEVHLLTTTGLGVDGLSYLYPLGPSTPPTVTLARIPSGSGAFFAGTPTPGASNLEAAP
jgi:hypothetical protein